MNRTPCHLNCFFLLYFFHSPRELTFGLNKQRKNQSGSRKKLLGYKILSCCCLNCYCYFLGGGEGILELLLCYFISLALVLWGSILSAVRYVWELDMALLNFPLTNFQMMRIIRNWFRPESYRPYEYESDVRILDFKRYNGFLVRCSILAWWVIWIF